MFDENGNYREVETIKESDITSNRYTKIGNILQDYIDEDIEEQKNENSNKKDKQSENKNKQNNKKIYKYKIILLGESGVGKTCIINKYIFNKFESSIINPNEENSEINTKMIDIDDKKSVELSIYDTTNEKKMGKITRNYYTDAFGAIIVFDVGNKESFNKVKYWMKEINNYAPKDIIICLLANKSDISAGREVTNEEAKELAGENLFFEISAKDGNNISLAFEQLSFKILREQKKRKLENDQVLRGVDGRKSINLADINVNKNKKGKCC